MDVQSTPTRRKRASPSRIHAGTGSTPNRRAGASPAPLVHHVGRTTFGTKGGRASPTKIKAPAASELELKLMGQLQLPGHQPGAVSSQARTLAKQNQLAFDAESKGDYVQAELLFAAVFAGTQRVAGDEHVATIAAEQNLRRVRSVGHPIQASWAAPGHLEARLAASAASASATQAASEPEPEPEPEPEHPSPPSPSRTLALLPHEPKWREREHQRATTHANHASVAGAVSVREIFSGLDWSTRGSTTQGESEAEGGSSATQQLARRQPILKRYSPPPAAPGVYMTGGSHSNAAAAPTENETVHTLRAQVASLKAQFGVRKSAQHALNAEHAKALAKLQDELHLAKQAKDAALALAAVRSVSTTMKAPQL